jgi:hypothetical protein
VFRMPSGQHYIRLVKRADDANHIELHMNRIPSLAAPSTARGNAAALSAEREDRPQERPATLGG